MRHTFGFCWAKALGKLTAPLRQEIASTARRRSKQPFLRLDWSKNYTRVFVVNESPSVAKLGRARALGSRFRQELADQLEQIERAVGLGDIGVGTGRQRLPVI